MYCVIQLTTTAGQVGILSEYPGTNYIWGTTGSGRMYSLYANGQWQLYPDTAPSSASAFQLYQIYSTGTKVGRRINAVFGGSGTDQYTNYSYPARSGTRTIGLLNNSPAGQWEASAGLLISEIIVYDSALTDVQRSEVEGYLTWKWGLQSSLVSTHLFRPMKPYTRPFQPVDIGGCALWLDGVDSASMTFSSGSNISTWNDKSGNGHVCSNAFGTSTFAQNSLNGYNSVYTPISNAMSISNFTWRTKFVAFIVGKAATRGWYLIGQGGSSYIFGGNYDLMCITGTSSTLNLYDSVNGLGTSITGTSPFLLAMGYDNATSSNANPYTLNGTDRFTRVDGGSSVVVDQTLTNTFYINSLNGTSTNTYDTINTGEILLYNDSLTTAQRKQIEGYLAWKWGLYTQLPSTHVYYKNPASSVLPFSPLSIAGCVVWSDAAPQTSVSSWTNLGSGGAVACSGSVNPSGRNGVTTVLLTTGQTWTMSTTLNLPAYTMFWSGRQTGTYSRVLQSTTNNQLFGYWGTNKGTFYVDGNPSQLSGLGGGNTSWDMFSHSRVAGGAYTFNWNGTSLYSGSTSTANNLTGLAINTGGSPNETSSVEIGEIIVYNIVLPTAQIQQIEGYLAWKWGMQSSLPSTHPYYKFVPSFQIYTPPVVTTVVSQYVNYLYTTFYPSSYSTPDVNGPPGSGWGSQMGTPGYYNPINFQNNDSRAAGTNNFQCVSTGYVYAPNASTTIQFQTISDDGIVIFLNGSQVLNNWGPHGDTTNFSSTITLPAGYTPITIRFFDSGGGLTYEVYISVNGGGWTGDATGVFYSTAQYVPPYPPLVYLSATSYSGSGTWNDLSTYGRNATIENGTAAKNAAGNGVVLDGATNWIFPNVAAGNTWSFGLWYKSYGTPPEPACVLSQIFPGSTNTINMMMGWGSTFYVGFYNNGWHISSQFSLASTWTNYQATWDGSTLNCYINGSLYSSGNPGGPSVDSGAQYRIGRRWDNLNFVSGEFGELRIFGSALTAAQVLTEYNSFSSLYP